MDLRLNYVIQKSIKMNGFIKVSLLRAILALGSAFSLQSAVAANYLTTPSDTSATPATKSLYTYLATRRGAENNRMVEGQHLGGINQLYAHFDYDVHRINDGTSD